MRATASPSGEMDAAQAFTPGGRWERCERERGAAVRKREKPRGLGPWFSDRSVEDERRKASGNCGSSAQARTWSGVHVVCAARERRPCASLQHYCVPEAQGPVVRLLRQVNLYE